MIQHDASDGVKLQHFQKKTNDFISKIVSSLP